MEQIVWEGGVWRKRETDLHSTLIFLLRRNDRGCSDDELARGSRRPDSARRTRTNTFPRVCIGRVSGNDLVNIYTPGEIVVFVSPFQELNPEVSLSTTGPLGWT